MADKIYDVIVVGGGAVGLGATYQVSKSGASVLVLEQNCFYNQAGSSGDQCRMYRTMYTEDYMADIANDSLAIWNALEEDAGCKLRTMTGLLNFGDANIGKETPEGTLTGPIENLQRLNMKYRTLNKEQIEKEYPFKNLPKNWQGVYAPDNGVINVPLMLRTLSRLAQGYGAEFEQYVEVKKLVPEERDGKKIWRVEAARHGKEKLEYCARKIIITSGAYTNHVTEPSFDLKLKLNIWEMIASYFSINAGPDSVKFPSMWFQFAKNRFADSRSQLFYGFPALEWGPPNVVRIAVDGATNQIGDPNERRTNVISPDDLADSQRFIKEHVVGVDSTVPAFAVSCLMANVFDNQFVLDYIPEQYLKGGEKDSVVLFTAGWAMKFVPLLGLALKDMALCGGSKYNRAEFKIDRKIKDSDELGVIEEASDSSPTAKISSLSVGPDSTSQGTGSSVHSSFAAQCASVGGH